MASHWDAAGAYRPVAASKGDAPGFEPAQAHEPSGPIDWPGAQAPNPVVVK